jgi:HPt (histidine-containing phosphotransfer) domain-containing protein
LDTLLQAGNVDAALQMLHTMKGVAVNLSMPELIIGIVELEMVFKESWQYEPELLTDFAKAQNRVLDSVRQLCGFGGKLSGS